MNGIDNVFSVDVEDYFHVQAFADRIKPDVWDQYESRVEKNTGRVLDLLNRHQTPATFFVLGWVAARFPQLVRRIQNAGHEIGCHSHLHQLVDRQTPDQFRYDLCRATDILQQITGSPVTAYRAPSFSINAKSLWALDVLIEEGYRVDSSMFPVHHDTYGVPDLDPAPHVIDRPRGGILEFPPAVRRKRFGNIPVAGGGYFRILPFAFTLHWLRNINRKEGRPVMFYIHPWELDPDQPDLPAGRRSRFRHYQNLRTTERKLDRLLAKFPFGMLRDAVDAAWPATASPLPTDTVLNLDVTTPDIDATPTTKVPVHCSARAGITTVNSKAIADRS